MTNLIKSILGIKPTKYEGKTKDLTHEMYHRLVNGHSITMYKTKWVLISDLYKKKKNPRTIYNALGDIMGMTKHGAKGIYNGEMYLVTAVSKQSKGI